MKTHENYFELSCRRNSRSARYLDVSIVAALHVPCTICTICTSASLLNRSAFQRFHRLTMTRWLDSVVPFVPLNHEIISHKFKLCCLIATSLRSWEVNAQELLLLGDKSHHKIARSNWSRRCSFIVFNLLSLHCFKWPWLHQKVTGETIRKTRSSTRCCKTISFWMALPSLASIYLHTWAGACAQARFNFW